MIPLRLIHEPTPHGTGRCKAHDPESTPVNPDRRPRQKIPIHLGETVAVRAARST